MSTPHEIRFPFETPPSEGEAVEVAPGILWARLPLPMALDHVNVYALDDGDGWTLIDTGTNNRHCQKALDALRAGPLAGKPIARVLMTHHHPDHVGQLGRLAADGAEVLATRTAWLMARMLTLDIQENLTPEAENFYLRAGMDPAILDERRTSRPFNFADIVAAIPLGFTRIDEGDRLHIGGRDWTVRLGNGHAAHHATLWSDDGVVIAGDQILPGISPNLGVYPTEPEADPVGEWLEACTRLRAAAKGPELVLPGHKLPFTGVIPRLTQLIENHHTALDRLRAHLAEPRTAHECFQPLYKRQISGGEYGLALVEAMGHLNHLFKAGEISRKLRPDGAWAWQIR
ncbi:MAG: MBL fold metallo-hydrolase [Pseudomonadota bacterium]